MLILLMRKRRRTTMGDGDVGIDNDDVLNDDLDHNGNGDVKIMVVLFLMIMNDDDHVLWM